MSTHNPKGRSKKEHRKFVMLEHYIMRSEAWLSLSPGARCAYVELRYIYDGSNNGRLAMSARDLAQRLRMSHVRCASYLRELVKAKFIEVAQAGGFSQKLGTRRATEYRLTSETCDVTGELATKKFMRQGAGGQEPPRDDDSGAAAGKTNGAGT